MSTGKMKDEVTMGDVVVDALGMLEGIASSIGTYDSRVVGRCEGKENNGVGVSSAWTGDCGFETALLPSKHKIVIVEQYADKEACEAGHEKWVAFAADESNKTALDIGYGGSIAESTMPIR